MRNAIMFNRTGKALVK